MTPTRYFLELETARFAARRVVGREALSEPFRFEVRLALPVGSLVEPRAIVKTGAAIVLANDLQDHRRIDGVVTDVRVTATAQGAPELYVLVEPRLSLLRYRADVRVFRDKTTPQIVEEVLGALGLLEMRLASTYAPRAYCVQMRETDLAFVERLLEEEGIAYFFEEGDRVVFTDDPGAFEPLAGGAVLPFRDDSALEATLEAIFEVGDLAELTAGEVTLRDFNPEHPSLDMRVGAPVAGPAPGPEHYDYPGGYEEISDGLRRARIRAEAFAAHASSSLGRSTCPRLVPGRVFELVDPPPEVIGGKLAVVGVTHDFESERAGFAVAFEAAPAARVWRPLQKTPHPTLPNPMTAFVTGPAGEDIHTDAVGRVKIRFPWDRTQPVDDTTSDWVPVLQDNTGHSVGIPRIGWEVLTHFLEGNPDRPVVLGRVYNGVDPFPEALPEHKTRSALRSLSSPSRDGTNVIRFDDLAGSEEVFIQAERDQRIVIAHDRREDIGVSESQRIGRDEVLEVAVDETEAVGADHNLTVVGDQSLSVGGKRRRDVAQMESATVGGDHALRIGSKHSRRIGTDDAVVAKRLTEKTGAVVLETSLGDNATSAGMAGSLTVGGALVELAAKAKSESVRLGRLETIGGVLFSKSGKATASGSKGRFINVGGAMTVNATLDITLDAGLKLATTSAMGSFVHAGGITIKVGGSSIVLSGDTIAITAPSGITVRVTGDNVSGSTLSTQA